MPWKPRIVAVGAAGVAGLVATGLFAGTLSLAAVGNLGAGKVAAPASCTPSLTVNPGDSQYDQADKQYEYISALVSGDLSDCLGVGATVSVIHNDAVISANATKYRITQSDVDAGQFEVPLDDGVYSGLTLASTKWGVVVESQPGGLGVTNILGTEADRSVALTWTAPAETGDNIVWGYRVEYAQDSAGSPGAWQLATSNTVSASPTATVNGLTNGTDYWFRVTPINYHGESPSAVSATTYNPYGAPLAPGALSAVSAGSGVMNLSWTAPDNNGRPITDYRIRYRDITADQWGEYVYAGDTGTDFQVTGLTSGHSYRFYVNAVNAAGNGEVATSSVVAATTPKLTPRILPTTISYPFGVAVDSTRVYTASRGFAQNRVAYYSKDPAGGDSELGYLVNGSSQGDAISIDYHDGYVYVANSNNGAWGNTVSRWAVDGSGGAVCWNIGNPVSHVLLSGGKAYVATWSDGIYVYNDTCGTARIAHLPANGVTGLAHPRQLAISGGELFVADPEVGVLVFDPADDGNVAPKRTITGAATGLTGGGAYTAGIAVNGSDLYVASYDHISVFDSDDSGNVAPRTVYNSDNTEEIAGAWQIQFEAGKLYVAMAEGSKIAIYDL